MTARIDLNLRLARSGFDLDVAFSSDSGLTAIFGKSGSGKTTLIDCIAGLVTPDQGRIVVDGRTLLDSAAGVVVPPERRRVGYVFQDARLFPHMRVDANLTYGMRMLPLDQRRQDVGEVIDLLGLEGLLTRRPAALSGGERQRVAIGRALLASPDILLMDEPLAALDQDRKSEILPFIERLRDQSGVPIVYVSHAADEVIRLADEMVVMADGRSIASGDVEDIMSRLDLRPHTGRFETGAVINVWVDRHHEEDGLTALSFGAGTLLVPQLEFPRGTPLRLRLRARDVWLSHERPSGTAILNMFEGTIVDIEDVAEKSPHVDVLVNIGAPIISRIARKAQREFAFEKGQRVYVAVKTASIDRQSLGLSRRR